MVELSKTGRVGENRCIIVEHKECRCYNFLLYDSPAEGLSHTQACIILLASQSLYYKEAKPQHGAVKKNEQGNSEGYVFPRTEIRRSN